MNIDSYQLSVVSYQFSLIKAALKIKFPFFVGADRIRPLDPAPRSRAYAIRPYEKRNLLLYVA